MKILHIFTDKKFINGSKIFNGLSNNNINVLISNRQKVGDNVLLFDNSKKNLKKNCCML